MNKLQEIQQKLKCPKGQFNSFGGFKYRSCEDILESVKPLLDKAELILSDDILEVGGRVYIKAKASLTDKETKEHWETTAFAREDEIKRGMDGSQITGSASSYARKYALNGLFLIDDVKDADARDNNIDTPEAKQDLFNEWMEKINKATTVNQLNAMWYQYKEQFDKDSDEYKQINRAAGDKKLELNNPDLKVEVRR